MEVMTKSAKSAIHILFSPKMATAMFAEPLENLQHSTRLIAESKSYAFKLKSISCNPRQAVTVFVKRETTCVAAVGCTNINAV
jgi:hypothetical protein